MVPIEKYSKKAASPTRAPLTEENPQKLNNKPPTDNEEHDVYAKRQPNTPCTGRESRHGLTAGLTQPHRTNRRLLLLLLLRFGDALLVVDRLAALGFFVARVLDVRFALLGGLGLRDEKRGGWY